MSLFEDVNRELFSKNITTIVNKNLFLPIDSTHMLNNVINLWAKNKEPLYKLFGNKMIIHSDFIENFNSIYSQEAFVESIMHQFIDQLTKLFLNNELYIETEFLSFIKNNIGISGFPNNRVTKDFSSQYFNKSLKRDSKASKTFKYFINDPLILREVQDLYSLFLQQKFEKLSGRIYLSINPYDYLTMSENNHNWDSCHSIDGDYMVGNFGLMTDTVTAVAYLLTDNELKDPFNNYLSKIDMNWNSKRIRRLVHIKVDQETGKIIIVNNRSYPYELNDFNYHLEKIEKSLFSEVTFKNKSNLISYDKLIAYKQNYRGHIDIPIFSEFINILYTENLSLSENFIEIGDETICLYCGKNISSLDHCPICNECADIMFSRCDCCNNLLTKETENESAIIAENGDYLCNNCLEEFYEQCQVCNKIYHHEDIDYNEKIGLLECIDCKKKNRERYYEN